MIDECSREIWKQNRRYHSSHEVDQEKVNILCVSWRPTGIPARCRASEREHSLVLAIAMQLHNTAYPEAGPTHGTWDDLLCWRRKSGHLHLSNHTSEHLPQPAYLCLYSLCHGRGPGRMGKHHQIVRSRARLTRTDWKRRPTSSKTRPDQTRPDQPHDRRKSS